MKTVEPKSLSLAQHHHSAAPFFQPEESRQGFFGPATTPNQIMRMPDIQLNGDLDKRAQESAKELQTVIDGAVWKEIRKRVYPKESTAGIQRAKDRKAGKLPDMTGLGQIKTLENFAKAIKIIKGKWAGLSQDDRLKELSKAINTEMKSAGVAEFISVTKRKMDFKGSFSHGQWKFTISEDLISGVSLTDADAAELANTSLHEARHAEQQFLAARHSAGINKKTALELVAEQGIPKSIADQAVAMKFDAKTDAKVADLGKTMYQAMVTEGAKNQKISDDDGLSDMEVKRKDAEAALSQLKSSTTEANVANAIKHRDALRAQITLVEQLYTLYRNIPYEADAHEVGDAAELAFKGWK